jgi:hypothetical protein
MEKKPTSNLGAGLFAAVAGPSFAGKKEQGECRRE